MVPPRDLDSLDSGLVTRRSARSPVTNRAAGVLLCSLTAPCGPFPPKSSGRTGRVYVYPPNVGLYTGVGTGSAPGNVGWNTGVTTLTQCGADPMVAVCTHEHAVDGCGDLTGRQCLFRGGHG